ncbi:MAG: type II secretion system protein [Acidimicrobiales bacterium]
MLAALRERRNREDEGFTLIELMVVVLIIAILLAIAIPTFLGARDRANDRAAQSSLRNALTAAKTIFTDNQSYASADPAGLLLVEPSLTYLATGTTSETFKEVSVDGAAVSAWYGASKSKSGICYQIKDASGASGGTTYRKGSATCSATDAVTASASFTTDGW